MDKKVFGQRLASLRTQKGVSARDMSLSLSQSSGYINNIENGGNYPAMANFFLICEYLNVTPSEYFDDGMKYPDHMKNLIEKLKRLDARQLEMLSSLVDDLIK